MFGARKKFPEDEEPTIYTQVMAAFKRWQARYKRYKLQIPPQMRNRIILHYGLFKITWDWMIMMLVLYTAVEVPLVSSFVMTQVDKNKSKRPDVKGHTFESIKYLYPSAYPLLITDLCVDVIFMIDIVLNFRSTYVEEGEALVTNPFKIAIHYLKSYFLMDLVAAVPWELLINANDEGNTTLFSLLKTARLLRLFRAARKLDRNYEYMTSLLFLMLMFFMLVAHWMACAWYAIGFSEVEHLSTSWLYKLADESGKPFNFSGDPMLGPSLSARYLTSLYYVMTLCTTVGFGNVSANTNAERIFTICGMLLGAVMYAGIFGNVTAIIHGQYSSNFRYRKESMAINEFIHFFKVKNPLARRLREYSRHTWSQTKGTDMNKVLKKFPEGLQYEIHLHMHLTVLSDSFLFINAESSCLRSISMRMRRNHHLPGHYILYEGDEVDTLHLIKKGKIEILASGVPKGKLVEGDAFGISLRQSDVRSKAVISLRASACVDCHVIKIKELNDVLESYPHIRQHLLGLMDTAVQWPRDEQKAPNNGDISHILQEEIKPNRRRVESDARHFVSQTFKLRPIFGCKKGSDEEYNEGDPLSPYMQREASRKDQFDKTSHIPGFVNITDMSVLQPSVITGDENDEQREQHNGQEENDEPVLSDLPCTDCEGDAHILSHDMTDKFRQMSKDIKRLESKVDTLLNILAKKGGIESIQDNDSLSNAMSSSTTTTV
ncbi:potassium voltage-gated channel subfamily H member 7-like isoform X4 [Actinia tenebrosa]|uniref:Potassium voltage-gated channel subfamily H member 7-like isoform X4 n=1 Tax=Actinia tenebrosa TaxID=6105 RepID=A0A6P8HAX1_ACTTE|nr:potassium voltage-gated channel subfamily H member 7-like isoform X4 [Actinia tenebrosa]